MVSKLKTVLYFLVVLLGIAALKLLSEINYQTKQLYGPEWKLEWSDEFDQGNTIDSLTWDFVLGNGCPGLCGWGNNELEYYTDKEENVRVENGHLIIQIQSDTLTGYKYTSGKIRSVSDKSIKYGKVEVRAKLPKGRGTWPAIWMIPESSKYGVWPSSGEIDIMEHVGYDPDTIVGTVHTERYNHLKGTQKGKYHYVPDNEEAFHEYEIQWNPKKIDFLVDDSLYFTFDNEQHTTSEWPFDQEFYLILNLAVGGNWGGVKGIDDAIIGEQLLIDYVRVYKDKTEKKLF